MIWCVLCVGGHCSEYCCLSSALFFMCVVTVVVTVVSDVVTVVVTVVSVVVTDVITVVVTVVVMVVVEVLDAVTCSCVLSVPPQRRTPCPLWRRRPWIPPTWRLLSTVSLPVSTSLCGVYGGCLGLTVVMLCSGGDDNGFICVAFMVVMGNLFVFRWGCV